jgi:hypothetical protein
VYARFGDVVGGAANILKATYAPRNRYEIILNFMLVLSSSAAIQPVLYHGLKNDFTPAVGAFSVAITFFLIAIALLTLLILALAVSCQLSSNPSEVFDLGMLNEVRRSCCVVLTFITLGALSGTILHPAWIG